MPTDIHGCNKVDHPSCIVGVLTAASLLTIRGNAEVVTELHRRASSLSLISQYTFNPGTLLLAILTDK